MVEGMEDFFNLTLLSSSTRGYLLLQITIFSKSKGFQEFSAKKKFSTIGNETLFRMIYPSIKYLHLTVRFDGPL